LESNGKLISLCAIVKNESELLPDLLSYYEDLVDEFCILDTGSTDGTLDIKHPKLNLKQSERFRADTPIDDFSFAMARNEALEMASGRWFMISDMDDRLRPTDWKLTRKKVSECEASGYDMIVTAMQSENDRVGQPLFVRNRPRYRYIGRVHERIDLARMAKRMWVGDAIVDHIRPNSDPTTEVFQKKHQWYLRLALRDSEERPNDWHAQTVVLKELLTNRQFGQYMEKVPSVLGMPLPPGVSPENVAFIYLQVAGIYAMSAQVQKAMEWTRLAHYYDPHYPEITWFLGELYRQVGDYEIARMWFNTTLAMGERTSGFMIEKSYLAKRAQIGLEMIENEESGNVWYKDGLHFECQKGCTNCCHGPVFLAPPEYDMVAGALGVDEDVFMKEYIDDYTHIGRLKVATDGSPPCLGDDRCKIYENRPLVCKTFPFWANFLASPGAWEHAKKACPGIGKGRLYSCKEIQGKAQLTAATHRAWYRGFETLRRGELIRGT
jgi:glycosyltransferase involved in cell wall biosynthesis/Fe-S-cluster containining protein